MNSVISQGWTRSISNHEKYNIALWISAVNNADINKKILLGKKMYQSLGIDYFSLQYIDNKTIVTKVLK